MVDKFHKFPFIIIDKNNKIKNYSNNFENIWNDFIKLNIGNLADFIIEKLKVVNLLLVYLLISIFLVVDKDREDVIVSFIDITNISYKFEHYMDIDSFLHEIKNPLAVIDGVAQILMENNLDGYTSECIKIVCSELDRIKTLLDELKLIKRGELFKEVD